MALSTVRFPQLCLASKRAFRMHGEGLRAVVEPFAGCHIRLTCHWGNAGIMTRLNGWFQTRGGKAVHLPTPVCPRDQHSHRAELASSGRSGSSLSPGLACALSQVSPSRSFKPQLPSRNSQTPTGSFEGVEGCWAQCFVELHSLF